MAKEGKHNFDNKVLIGILIFLILAIVGLTVGIVIVSLRKNEDESLAEDTAQILDDANDEISPMTVGEAVEYLDAKILEYDGTEATEGLMIMKMNVYINGGEPEEALAVALMVDENKLSDAAKMDYYMALGKIYEALGDEKMANDFYDRYILIYNEIFGGGGGGD